MRLPGSDKALVEERKIKAYLLNPTHPDGKAKAQFFISRGYRLQKWQRRADDLRRHGQVNEVQRSVRSPYGARYRVLGPLATPSGGTVGLVSIWIVENGTDVPRLVTAYPE
jgi:hypothetical protein